MVDCKFTGLVAIVYTEDFWVGARLVGCAAIEWAQDSSVYAGTCECSDV